VRWRSVAPAVAGVILLVLGLWVLDWWTLKIPAGEVHANLLRIEACNADRCQTWRSGGGIVGTAVLVSGSLLALVTLVLGVLDGMRAPIGPRLVKVQVMLALLVLGGACLMIAMTPEGLSGAKLGLGGWLTLVATIFSAGAGIAILRGDDPLGEGVKYVPVKVDVPADVVASNERLAGATIPPFAVAQRKAGATAQPPMAQIKEAAAAQGHTVPPWQPAIKDTAHVEAPQPRRRSTRLPYTAPPTFDAARQTLRFVVAEAAIGEDGLTATLEDHRKVELAWKVFTRAAARQLPPGPPYDKLIVVDLVTVGGAPLRFLPSTRVNYAALPGGAAPNSRENLRRLVAHVKTKQPTFGVEHDSAEFFAGGREPPACTALKQFVTYDEQYSGVIGTPPDAAPYRT
jgi:hypothetical protein